MIVEEDISPGRWARLAETRLRKTLEDATRRRRIARVLERHPVGLRLNPPGEHVLNRKAHDLKGDNDEERKRNRLRAVQASPPSRHHRDKPGDRQREQAIPGDSFQDVVAGMMAEL